jgi:RNA polymerase sigma-70 factor (ECF subfamily)
MSSGGAEENVLEAALGREREHLFAIAYRMLGSAAEAEDVLQEAAVRARQAAGEGVDSPRAWLTTTVTRLCLDQLKSARRRREEYVGPWLPEPLMEGVEEAAPPADARVGLAESVSVAFLVLLERLSPAERAVFLLREVFDHDFGHIARVLGKSEAACRQLFHRAKEHVLAGRPRFTPFSPQHERLTKEFLRVTEAGDVDALSKMLAEDVTVWADGGGRVTAARNPISGADRVARYLVGVREKARSARFEVAPVNGEPGLRVWVGQRLVGAAAVEWHGERVAAVRLVLNPEKLGHLAARA